MSFDLKDSMHHIWVKNKILSFCYHFQVYFPTDVEDLEGKGLSIDVLGVHMVDFNVL